jgi:hypothetical protein
MPSLAQLNRLASLEAMTPSASKDAWPPDRVRGAIQDLLSAVGTSEDDPLLVWATTASDAELTDWWAGRV